MGILMDVNPHAEKALLPMDVTLLGIVMDVSPLQYSKAFLPILVTLLGIIVSLHPDKIVLVAVLMMALQLSRESYMVLPFSTLIEVRLQPEKAETPMLVTLLGMVTEVKPLQPEKAKSSMYLTLLGIVTEVRPLQLWKA